MNSQITMCGFVREQMKSPSVSFIFGFVAGWFVCAAIIVIFF